MLTQDIGIAVGILLLDAAGVWRAGNWRRSFHGDVVTPGYFNNLFPRVMITLLGIGLIVAAKRVDASIEKILFFSGISLVIASNAWVFFLAYKGEK
jgi:hypothetical protein